MGVKERQEREREAVGRSILDAARKLFVEQGYGNVSIRKIAEQIEYSPAAIYSYFPSKDDIFYALAEEGFRLMHDSVKLDPSPDAFEDIRRACWSVYEFSKAYPEYYALMFVDRSVPRIRRDWERFGFVHEMQHQVATVIDRAVKQGSLPAGTNAHAALMVLFAAIHGAAAMRLCDRLGATEDGDALARDTLETILKGMQVGITHNFVPDTCN